MIHRETPDAAAGFRQAHEVAGGGEECGDIGNNGHLGDEGVPESHKKDSDGVPKANRRTQSRRARQHKVALRAAGQQLSLEMVRTQRSGLDQASLWEVLESELPGIDLLGIAELEGLKQIP